MNPKQNPIQCDVTGAGIPLYPHLMLSVFAVPVCNVGDISDNWN